MPRYKSLDVLEGCRNVRHRLLDSLGNDSRTYRVLYIKVKDGLSFIGRLRGRIENNASAEIEESGFHLGKI